jgi:3-phytase/5'-nucleotidase
MAMAACLTLGLATTPAPSAAAVPLDAGSGAVAGAAGPAPERLDILLTNDDGWRGPGGSSTPLIVALRDRLVAAGHDVTVVAPGTDQSGQGARVSLPGTELTLANPSPDVFTLTPGSPADTVFFALDEIFATDPPDLVVSGMNPGLNLTSGIIHSGTVNAALTAVEHGVPSIAVSVEQPSDWPGAAVAAADQAAAYVTGVVDRLADGGPATPIALNLNYPVRPGPLDAETGLPRSVLPPRGTRATGIGGGVLVALAYTASGTPGTYTVGLGTPSPSTAPGTDFRAVADGFVSISALEADHDTDPSTTRWLRTLTRSLP